MKRMMLLLAFFGMLAMAMADWTYGTARFTGSQPTSCMTHGTVKMRYNGSDLELEEGPIITESEDGKYSVYYKYYSQGQNGKIYNPRGLLVTITKIDGKYMISDYELVMPDIVQKPSDLTEGVDGQYRLRDGRMFLHFEKEGRNIEADFNFRDGTYVSATYTFSCSIDDENKLSSAVYKMNGTHAGKIEGFLDKKVMKVDVRVDDRYSDSYEFKLE